MPRVSTKPKPGPERRFDTELRVYVTQSQHDAVSNLAYREERLLSNMVRVLINEALLARNELPEAEMKRARESSA